MNAETKISADTRETVLAAQLSALRADIVDTIDANDAAQVDRIDRIRLDGMSERLGRYLRNIDRLGGEAPLFAGENMHGPAIRDLIETSKNVRGS